MKTSTPPKFNMEPENDGFQEELPFLGTSFQVNHVKFQGCKDIFFVASGDINITGDVFRTEALIRETLAAKGGGVKNPEIRPVYGEVCLYMAENSGFSPQIIIGFSIINHPFWGSTILGNSRVIQIFIPWKAMIIDMMESGRQ